VEADDGRGVRDPEEGEEGALEGRVVEELRRLEDEDAVAVVALERAERVVVGVVVGRDRGLLGRRGCLGEGEVPLVELVVEAVVRAPVVARPERARGAADVGPPRVRPDSRRAVAADGDDADVRPGREVPAARARARTRRGEEKRRPGRRRPDDAADGRCA